MASSSPSGVDLEESSNIMAAAAGVALSFPANDSPSPSKLPCRLRRRLSKRRSPSTAEEIEAKLRDADLRRQHFYEMLSGKARLKQRSPSQSSQEVDPGQRLEAKLNAAEQKRLSIRAKAQMRLARLDEMRQAAKSGMENRVEKQRGELVMKMQSRVQRAEVNRMLILKSCRQRRAERKERAAQSLKRRMMQESKYREYVRAAIHQKRIAAERKRLGILEAERLKAHAMLVQVQKATNSCYTQREMERVKRKNQLENRLQRARRQRAELLRQRNIPNCLPHANARMMHEQTENLARRLARCWRQFMKLGSTYSLTKAFEDLSINNKSVKLTPFEQLTLHIESDVTLRTLKSLLDRLEVHLGARYGTSYLSVMENIDHLLKRVATPKRRCHVSHASRSVGQKRAVSGEVMTQSGHKLSRYQVRIVLCAYMILGHRDAVLNGKGSHETALAEAAVKFIQEFELLIRIILEGGRVTSSGNVYVTFRSQLEAFDKAWCSYLYRFTIWKVRDAKLLEEDLVRAACQLKLSMMRTCKPAPEGNSICLTQNMEAIQKQVMEDQTLLREKVQNLSGDAGIKRLETALADVRTIFFTSKESGSLLVSPVSHNSSPGYTGLSGCSPSSDNGSNTAGTSERPSSVPRSLFKEDDTTSGDQMIQSPLAKHDAIQRSYDILPITENELLVNKIVHERLHCFADNLDNGYEDDSNINGKIKETMERAFWDGIIESLKREQPDFSWVLKLLREVRDELCEISPGNWKQEITEAIDIDILSQVLRGGPLDMNYLGKILKYALVTLQKLSAPANDDEMKITHQNLLKELTETAQTGDDTKSSCAIAVIEGLRFVLQQIQALKREISRARIRMIEPVIKGPAGLEYLRKAFSNRYGPPSDASNSLPLTKRWMSSLRNDAEREWCEYIDSISSLSSAHATHPQGLLPTTLRTGGSVPVSSRLYSLETTTTGKEQSECQGERIDLLVRLGLLKLVSEIEGLVQESLPETLKLNVSGLRAVQSLLQKLIVISTSTLVLRQTLLSEHLVAGPSDKENIVSRSAKQLSELLDRVEDVGVTEMVEAIVGLPEEINHVVNLENLQARKEVIANMLSKSLKAGDAIFTRVSQAIYLAARGALLGGTGSTGRLLVEIGLQRLGAVHLTDKVIEAAEALIVVATVSRSVHGSWYDQLLNMCNV